MDRVEFVTIDKEVEYVPSGHKLVPKGKLAWVQRLFWRALYKMGSLEETYDMRVGHRRHIFTASKLSEAVRDSYFSVYDFQDKPPSRLVIGAEDYSRMMGEPDIVQYVQFDARMPTNRGFMGMKVEIVPWMRGFVVLR